MAARVSLENSMHDWVAFFSRGVPPIRLPIPCHLAPSWHLPWTSGESSFATLGPTFAKHTFYKSIHKGWFWNTQSNMFFKSTSVFLDLSCGKKRPNHGLPFFSGVGIRQFLAIVSKISGISGDSSFCSGKLLNHAYEHLHILWMQHT